jgi:Fe-S cluster assembly iron-binding protein IscA
MLMLTENATRVIGALVDDPELPDGAGLRIVSAPEGLSVSPASGPGDDDQVVEEQSARVFLEPDAAVVLDDKVLDAQVDDTGHVQFLLGSQ